MADVLIEGMHGLGDNLHQRAVVRHHVKSGATVWLTTPWPQLYHDLVGEKLKLVAPKSVSLRTQAKNAARSAGYYSRAPSAGVRFKVWYPPEIVRRRGSVLGAMLEACAVPQSEHDFRLPVPTAWRAKAAALIDRWKPTRPIMIYRPLVERTEWSGCHARNPDAYAYGVIAAKLSETFFVVSVADLVPDVEWIAGADIDADVKLHAGELDVETLVGLTSSAALVYSAPGFAVVLAQAVGTPSVCVFGGYEDSHSFSLGGRLTPHMGVDTISPCQCFRHNHACEKRIDLLPSLRRVMEFADAAATPSQSRAA